MKKLVFPGILRDGAAAVLCSEQNVTRRSASPWIKPAAAMLHLVWSRTDVLWYLDDGLDQKPRRCGHLVPPPGGWCGHLLHRSGQQFPVNSNLGFRSQRVPELWDPLTGGSRPFRSISMAAGTRWCPSACQRPDRGSQVVIPHTQHQAIPHMKSLGSLHDQKRILTSMLVVITTSIAAAAERPNILFLFTDDQRADAIAALDNPVIKTPNIDRIARNGLAFPPESGLLRCVMFFDA